MQTQSLNRVLEPAGIAPKTVPPARHGVAGAAGRPAIRPTLPLRRRESCLTRCAMLAALREAELAEWLDCGGDYLNSMHQPAT